MNEEFHAKAKVAKGAHTNSPELKRLRTFVFAGMWTPQVLKILSKPTRWRYAVFGFPFLVLIKKLELFIPWWLENRT